MAQGGGPDVTKISIALKSVEDFVKENT
jgi:hypothetical protein